MRNESELQAFGPWPQGLNNVTPDLDFPAEALRNAVNVDVLDDGRLRRRAGYAQRWAGAVHSLFSGHGQLVGVVGTDLVRFAVEPNSLRIAQTLRAGLTPGARMAYLAHEDGSVYFSNGVQTGRLLGGRARSWGIAGPTQQPPLSTFPNGGLSEGLYQVSVTFVSSTGEESGTGPAASVSMSAGHGLGLDAFPTTTDPDVVALHVYITEPNQTIPYLRARLPINANGWAFTRSATQGRPLATRHFRVPLPEHSITYYRGRLYWVEGRFLRYSESLRFGATQARNYYDFGAPIGVLTRAENGLYVCAEQTFFLRGTGPGNFERERRLPYGAFRGSLVHYPNTLESAWLSPRGLIHADGSGGVRAVHEGRLVLAPHGQASLAYREHNGLKQLVAMLSEPEFTAPALQAEDFLEAERFRLNLREAT